MNLEDQHERAKLQAEIDRLTGKTRIGSVEDDVRRIKAVIEAAARKESALSELNQWKRERFAELDAAVVRKDITEDEAKDQKELINHLIHQETRG